MFSVVVVFLGGKRLAGWNRGQFLGTTVPHVVWRQQIQDGGDEFWPILIEQVRGAQHFSNGKLLQTTTFDTNYQAKHTGQ